MDGDSWLGVVLLVVMAVALSCTVATATMRFFTAADHKGVGGRRSGAHGEGLLHYADERERVLGAVALAHACALVTATAIAVTLVVRQTGLSWRPVVFASVTVVLVAGLLEAATRWIVLSNPDRWIALLQPMAAVIRAIFLVPAYLLDLPGRALVSLPLLRGTSATPRDEDEDLLRLVEMEEIEGGIEPEERRMIRAVIELEDRTAREIMVPRIDVTAVDVHASLHDVAEVIRDRGYSRIPLYEGSIDNVIGVIYAKDVLTHLASGVTDADLRAVARQPLFVPESKPVDELLRELRARRIHMAIVVDEYGGTAGLLTIEDLVEEIVGEIEDEYDRAEPAVQRIGDGEAVVDARENVHVLKDLFDVDVEGEDFDTIGGYVTHRLGRIPTVNDAVEVAGVRIQVLSVAGRRVRRVRISRAKTTTVPTAGG